MVAVAAQTSRCLLGFAEVAPRGRAIVGARGNDETEFGDPENIRFDRSGARSMIFGTGPHRCLGSHLARVELRVALEELRRVIPDYRIPAGFDLVFSGHLRTANPLPLEWD